MCYVRQEILAQLIALRRDGSYDLVFISSLHDIHQGHTTVAQEALRVFKYTTILGYELIWNYLAFNTQCFVRLDREHVDVKIGGLRESHSEGQRDYLSVDLVRTLARGKGRRRAASTQRSSRQYGCSCREDYRRYSV